MWVFKAIHILPIKSCFSLYCLQRVPDSKVRLSIETF